VQVLSFGKWYILWGRVARLSNATFIWLIFIVPHFEDLVFYQGKIKLSVIVDTLKMSISLGEKTKTLHTKVRL
jgi:hypothetical protein